VNDTEREVAAETEGIGVGDSILNSGEIATNAATLPVRKAAILQPGANPPARAEGLA